MSKISSDTGKSLELISSHAYNIAKELEDLLKEEYIDSALVDDIAKAFTAWRGRVNQIQNPYCVWYWDGQSWAKVTKDMYQEDAYKEWYRLTKGGKVSGNPTCENYYFLGSATQAMTERHPREVESDDFSIRYLLSKSFGE